MASNNLETMLKLISKLVVMAVVATLTLGVPATANAVANCIAAPSLSSVATATKLSGFSNGAGAGYYSFSAGEANDSIFPTRVSYFTASLDKYKISAVHSRMTVTNTQYSLAGSSPTSVGYMNTDFFGDRYGNNLPYSAIVKNSQLVYMPYLTNSLVERVVGMEESKDSETTGYTASSLMKSGNVSYRVVGVNLSTIAANSLVAFTPKFISKTIVRGTYGVLVSKNKVVALYPKGTNKRPTVGTVIQATGTQVARLKKLKVGSPAVFTLPAKPRYKIVVDRIGSSGYVQVSGRSKINITAVNFSNAVTTGAILYDANYYSSGTYTPQWLGAKTLVLSANGTVVKMYASGKAVVPSGSYPYVLQISSADAASLGSPLPVVGTQLTLKRTIRSSGGHNLISAMGRGDLILSNGVNLEACDTNTEQIRPRSALGWNDQGQFWFMTTTAGDGSGEFGGWRAGGSSIHQIGDWLKQVGATEAVFFDGGGSTAMLVNPGTGYQRLDLPENVLLRAIPVGIVALPIG